MNNQQSDYLDYQIMLWLKLQSRHYRNNFKRVPNDEWRIGDFRALHYEWAFGVAE